MKEKDRFPIEPNSRNEDIEGFVIFDSDGNAIGFSVFGKGSLDYADKKTLEGTVVVVRPPLTKP